MNPNLSPRQFGGDNPTLGSLKSGQRFTLPGHDGVFTATRVNVRPGKTLVSYRHGDDPQEYAYEGPSLKEVGRA